MITYDNGNLCPYSGYSMHTCSCGICEAYRETYCDDSESVPLCQECAMPAASRSTYGGGGYYCGEGRCIQVVTLPMFEAAEPEPAPEEPELCRESYYGLTDCTCPLEHKRDRR